MIRYSRVLVNLPPLDSVISGVKKYLSKNLPILPEFIDTPGLLGFAIDWPTWSFSGISKWMKRIQNKYECPVLDYTDEDRFDFLNLEEKKDFKELYLGFYTEGHIEVSVYPDHLLLDGKTKLKYSSLQVRHLELIQALNIMNTFKILYQRGYFNRPEVDYKLKCWFYDNILMC